MEKLRNKSKNVKGITLISLVITIFAISAIVLGIIFYIKSQKSNSQITSETTNQTNNQTINQEQVNDTRKENTSSPKTTQLQSSKGITVVPTMNDTIKADSSW